MFNNLKKVKKIKIKNRWEICIPQVPILKINNNNFQILVQKKKNNPELKRKNNHFLPFRTMQTLFKMGKIKEKRNKRNVSVSPFIAQFEKKGKVSLGN